MSGQQEPRSETGQFDQLDPRDSTLDLSGLISRLNNGSERTAGANGHGALAAYGAHVTRAARPDVTVQPDACAEPDVAEPDVTVEADAPAAQADSRPPPTPSAPPDPPRQAATPERPAPGSLADLRQRLERLPYGHPSSPYHVDGERKPPPYRLKHLELAPPAPSRSTQAYSQPAVVDDDPIAAAAPIPPIAPSPPAAPAPTTADGTQTQGSLSSLAPALTQDQERIADDAYDRFRGAEGRNLFGSYGDEGLTVVLRDVAASLEYGELAPDTEQNSLLEPDAFKARFANMLARYPDRSAELLARRVPGAISYSFIFDAVRYSAGIWMVQDALAAAGFQLLARRNDWNNAANRCVATMWHDPTSGLPFEVQFHTTASLEAQQLARSSTTLISDPRIPSAEAASLKSDLAAAWAALPAPPGHGQIAEYRRDGGSPLPGSQQPGSQPVGGQTAASPASG
jgi:hypothetical protein